MRTKYGYEWNNMRQLEKQYNLADDGPFAVYEQKDGWQYKHLAHECVLYKLMQQLSELIGYKCTDLAYWLEEDKTDGTYVVQIPTKVNTKKMKALIELGFN